MIVLISGKPGGGKSYELVRKVKIWLKSGRLVFCDIPVYVRKGKKILRVAKLERHMIRDFAFPEGCAIAINEGGSWFDSRNFNRDASRDANAFTTDDLVCFTQHRQTGIDMIIVAQDIGMLDVNIRRCTEKFWQIKSIPPSDFEWYYKGLKLPPWFFIQKAYYSEVDYAQVNPKEKPYIRIIRFKYSIAKCYDTKFHKYLMASRPIKEYSYWVYDHFTGIKKPFTHIVYLPDYKGRLKKHYKIGDEVIRIYEENITEEIKKRLYVAYQLLRIKKVGSIADIIHDDVADIDNRDIL